MIKNIILSIFSTVCLNLIIKQFNPYLKKLLIGTDFVIYPITFQNVMWVFFFFSIFEILEFKKLNIKFNSFFFKKYLPEEIEAIINEENMGDIFKSSNKDKNEKMGHLPRLIFEVISQFRVNKNVDLAHQTLNGQTDIILNDLELKYSKLKYISWLIPTLGFMGTVLGISLTVSSLNEMNPSDPKLISVMAENLATAFNTTLLALGHSAIIMYLTQSVQGREEEILNKSIDYISKNLLNRLIHEK
jgi:biopolymer transport protein ExbB/TolQ